MPAAARARPSGPQGAVSPRRAGIPDAVEAISYGIPAFTVGGRAVIYCAAPVASCSRAVVVSSPHLLAPPDALRRSQLQTYRILH